MLQLRCVTDRCRNFEVRHAWARLARRKRARLASCDIRAQQLPEPIDLGAYDDGVEPVLAIPDDPAGLCRHAERELRGRAQSGRRHLQAAGPDSLEPGRRARRAECRRGRGSLEARLLHGLHQMDQGQSLQPSALPPQRSLHRRAEGHLVGGLGSEVRSRSRYR
ncbi:hypothetical protein chiPu_0032538, partial [Chiloscyllium punctatum]|nr:hypothetical protein [Chiloscyllium punctatum]